MSNNTDIRVHAGPANFSLNGFEEGVNEGPAVFERGGHAYLFFSAARFDSQYATFYVMGNTTADLTRNLPLQRLTTPVRRNNGDLIETHGHNAVSTRRGEVFNFFHIGIFDGAGNFIGRDTYRQRITWNPDGTAMNQNQVALSWNSLGAGWGYSLDLVLRSGETIGPCIANGIIGQQTSVNYLGVCPDASDRLVHRAEVAAFRLYASNGGAWTKVGETPYDSYSDTLKMTITAP
jgi:hypothetical protein